MDLDDGAVEQHRLQSEAHDPLPLQLVEDLVEHLVLQPAIHARVCPAEPGRALDFVAPLVHLPVVFPGVAPAPERRNYGCEAESRWRVASPS